MKQHFHRNLFRYFLTLTLIVVAASFVAVGYTVGVHDQGIYIPMVRRLLNPASYPGDPLLMSAGDNTTMIWTLSLPVFQILGIEWGMFVLQLIALGVFFSGIYYVVKDLTGNRFAGLLAANIFAFRKLTFFTITTFNDYFAPRFMALGLGVWALHFALQKRWLPATLLLILSCYVNMIVGLPLAGAVLLAFVLNARRIGIPKVLGSAAIFLAGLLPFAIFRAGATATGFGFGIDESWFAFVRDSLYVHFSYPVFNQDPIWNLAILLGFLQVLLVPYLLVSSQIQLWQKRVLQTMHIALFSVFCVNYVLIEFYPVSILMQLQLTRVAIFFPILFYLSYIVWVWQRYKDSSQMLALSAVWGYIGFGPFWVLLVLAAEHSVHVFKLPPRRVMLSFTWLLTGAALAAFLLGVTVFNPNAGVNIYPKPSPELDIQGWLKYNTAPAARIVAPAHINELYTPNFRVFSERYVLVTNSELGAAAVSPGFDRSVRERLDDISKGSFSRDLHSRDYGKIFWGLRQNYLALTEEDFIRLQSKYDLDFVITEVEQQLSFPLVYQNSGYRIYYLLP